jgi:hypothetical protein
MRPTINIQVHRDSHQYAKILAASRGQTVRATYEAALLAYMTPADRSMIASIINEQDGDQAGDRRPA